MSRVTGWTGAAYPTDMPEPQDRKRLSYDEIDMDDYDPMESPLARDPYWAETMTGAEGYVRPRPLVAT